MQELLTKGIGIRDTEIGRIPRDWEVAKLSEVSEINPESIDSTVEIPDREFLYVDIESIRNGVIRSYKKILGKDAPSRARRIIRENDEIMSTVRPYLKAFAIVPKELDGHICSTGFAVLRAKSNL